MQEKSLFDFDNSYSKLPRVFYRSVTPTPVREPHLIAFNAVLADDLGMRTGINKPELADIFSGNIIPQGANPIAVAYAGHQFGQFVPQLGDGRAILLGEVIDQYGERRDIQLKGSGQTPFSRRGDGRAALGPVIREYIVSEAMHALGIKTTRALAAVTTGEPVMRETLLPGAVITRVAFSHIRIGTFEYFAARGDTESVKQLANYVIDRHYPETKNAENPYCALLQAVMRAEAKLVASWLHVGFIHGVMNTDNMAVSGETIDYGPCAFMDAYNPRTVFSSIDTYGRYAFANQPRIANWNLARFAETLLPLLASDTETAIGLAEEMLSTFIPSFEEYWLEGMCKKLGLQAANEDIPFIQEWLDLMQRNGADYTLTFRLLCDAAENDTAGAQLSAVFAQTPAEFQAWLTRWKTRLEGQSQHAGEIAHAMRQVNPAYIPRNHLVESAIEAAVKQNDFSVMKRLMDVLAQPYTEREEYEEYKYPPAISDPTYRTFCGT